MPCTSYDEIAPHYDQAMNRLERWVFPGLRAEALSRLPPGSQILEVGAGTGLNFRLYPERSRGIATEPNGEMIKLAQARQEPHITLVRNAAEKLPFVDGSFDAAFATLVFCSVSSPMASFQELRRVVRAGGTIVLLEHVRPRGVLGPLFDLLNLITVSLADDHFNRRTAELAQAAGLDVVEVKTHALSILNLITCKV